MLLDASLHDSLRSLYVREAGLQALAGRYFCCLECRDVTPQNGLRFANLVHLQANGAPIRLDAGISCSIGVGLLRSRASRGARGTALGPGRTVTLVMCRISVLLYLGLLL